ncbi:MAG TPA: cupin domain-containing protein [Vicinamibacterales bacterium]|nr:cupin domain-containing protein [Vicinamibacterales bacterium]
MSEAVGATIRPVRVDELPWETWAEGVRYGGRVRRLSGPVGSTRVGVLIEELPPKRQSAPLHWHTDEEEHVWILDGNVTLRLGDERHALGPGDYVCFPAGQALGHCLVNESEAPCRYLVIGERSPDDVCVYPDSGKVLIRATGRTIVSLREPLDYWDGEKADEPIA